VNLGEELLLTEAKSKNTTKEFLLKFVPETEPPSPFAVLL